MLPILTTKNNDVRAAMLWRRKTTSLTKTMINGPNNTTQPRCLFSIELLLDFDARLSIMFLSKNKQPETNCRGIPSSMLGPAMHRSAILNDEFRASVQISVIAAWGCASTKIVVITKTVLKTRYFKCLRHLEATRMFPFLGLSIKTSRFQAHTTPCLNPLWNVVSNI
jgi:hypothetical protein